MRHHLRTLVVTALLTMLAGAPTRARADVVEYSGEASVIGGTLLGLPIDIVTTGPLPPAGGMLSAGLPNFSLLGLISADLLQATTTGAGNQSTSNATISNVVLTLGLITIEATLLQADATATCTGNVASVSGSSTVVGLTVNGMGITVTGSPNQVVPLPLGLGQIVINEQSSTVAGNMGEITVTALHATVDNVLGAQIADLFISTAHADVVCGAASTTSTSTSSSSSSSESTTSTSTSSSSTSSSSSTTTSSSVVTSTLGTSTTSSSSTSSSSSTTSTTIVINADHYKCYKTRGARLSPRQVTLADQFTTETVTVRRPFRLCNPADKNGEGIVDPTSHLMCYRISAQPFQERTVLSQNQFGDHFLRITRPDSLCNPAAKNHIESDLQINHYKCYRARSLFHFTPIQVTVSDQFETRTGTLVKPLLFCNPVNKNGEGILDPTAHQTCYKFQPSPTPFQSPTVNVLDQFGALDLQAISGECRKADLLCVPSMKTEL